MELEDVPADLGASSHCPADVPSLCADAAQHQTGFHSFVYAVSFLDDTHFVTAGPDGLTIHKYDASAESHAPSQEAGYVCKLHLPESVDGSYMHHCQLSSCSRTPSGPPRTGDAHFDAPAEDLLITVSFTMGVITRQSDLQQSDFLIVIPRRSIDAFIAAAAHSPAARDLRWSDWQSQDIRIMETPMRKAADNTVLGWKVCGASHNMDMAPRLGVYDFSELVHRPGASAPLPPRDAATHVLVTTKTRSSLPRFFKEKAVATVCRRVRQKRVGAGSALTHLVRVIFTVDGFIVFVRVSRLPVCVCVSILTICGLAQDANMMHGRAYLF